MFRRDNPNGLSVSEYQALSSPGPTWPPATHRRDAGDVSGDPSSRAGVQRVRGTVVLRRQVDDGRSSARQRKRVAESTPGLEERVEIDELTIQSEAIMPTCLSRHSYGRVLLHVKPLSEDS